MRFLWWNNLIFLSFLFFVGGFGGAHAIAIALAVKAKIVLVTVLLIASFLYYTKVLTIGKSAGGGGGGGGGGCDHPNEYREGAIIPIEHDHS